MSFGMSHQYNLRMFLHVYAFFYMWFYVPTVEMLPNTCDSFKLNLYRRSEQDDERMETERQEWKGYGRGRERIQGGRCGMILSVAVHPIMLCVNTKLM